jgi:hypothetical protein
MACFLQKPAWTPATLPQAELLWQAMYDTNTAS